MKREPQHTPGPWQPSSCAGLVITAAGQRVADTHFTGSVPCPESRANAALIAAAPDLAAALAALLPAALPTRSELTAAQYAAAIDAARAALRKAGLL